MTAATAVTDPTATGEPFGSIQIGPESLIDEGFDHVLDDGRRRAAGNAVLVSTHSLSCVGGSVHSWGPRARHRRHLRRTGYALEGAAVIPAGAAVP